MKKPYTLAERKARGAIFCEPGLTEQSHKASCDINTIMSQYSETGTLPIYANTVPKYGDFSNVTDYHTALNLVLDAQDAFDSLPGSLRKEFNFDPQEFMNALADPAQKDRLKKAGVVFPDENLSEKPLPNVDSSDENLTKEP